MDLFDIILVKKLIEKLNPGSGSISPDSPEIQEIVKQLEEKVSQDEMKAYVKSSIENLPTLSDEEIKNLLK